MKFEYLLVKNVAFDVIDTLNKYGNDGWELVNLIEKVEPKYISPKNSLTLSGYELIQVQELYFKRLKKDYESN